MDNMVDGSRQIQRQLRASPEFTATVDPTCILTVPLRRADMDENAAANVQAYPETPQCFEDDPPHFLRPSVSIWCGGSAIRADLFRGRYLPVPYTIAMYTGPVDHEITLFRMRSLMASAIHRMVIDIDGMGLKGRLWLDADMATMVPVPDFPGAGYMMMERATAIAVWRRQ